MPGIYGFDHIVVRVEDFNVGMGDMGSLPGLELRETGENPCEDASLASTRSRSLSVVLLLRPLAPLERTCPVRHRPHSPFLDPTM